MISEIIETLKDLKYTILIFRNPCKKCIVRACCTQYCQEKQDLINFIAGDTITIKRLCAASIWVGVLSMTINMFFIIW